MGVAESVTRRVGSINGALSETAYWIGCCLKSTGKLLSLWVEELEEQDHQTAADEVAGAPENLLISDET